MNKTIFIIFMFCLLSGCGRLNRIYTGITGDLTYKCTKTGTQYVQSDSGLAPLYKTDGKIATCEPEEQKSLKDMVGL